MKRLFKIFVLMLLLIFAAAVGVLAANWSMQRESLDSCSGSLASFSSESVSSSLETAPCVNFILENHTAIPIRISGLNCDMMTVDAKGTIYLANPRFMPTFSDCTAEGSAYLQGNDQIVVHLTKAAVTSRPNGTVTGPQIHFVVDYKNGELISSEVEELEGNTIQMPESEQEKWGCVLASFILTAKTIEENLYNSSFAFEKPSNSVP